MSLAFSFLFSLFCVRSAFFLLSGSYSEETVSVGECLVVRYMIIGKGSRVLALLFTWLWTNIIWRMDWNIHSHA